MFRRACPLHIFVGPAAAVLGRACIGKRPALGYWGEAAGFLEPAAHVLKGLGMRTFVDPLWFVRQGSAAYGPQHYSAVHDVINRGLGFKAFSRIVDRDASGGGCAGVSAPWGAFIFVGLHSVSFDLWGVQWVRRACVV